MMGGWLENMGKENGWDGDGIERQVRSGLFVFPPRALVEGNPSAGSRQPCSNTFSHLYRLNLLFCVGSESTSLFP
jgi:hypothetical protein